MSTRKSMARSIKSSQLRMREVLFTFTGASGDVVGGPDRLLVTATDLGAGNYLFVLDPKARATYGADVLLKGFSSLTADCVVQVTAVDDDRITVQCLVGGAAADADITLCLGIHDWKIEYSA